MSGICFYFENSDVDVWSGKDLDAWNYACKIGGGIDSVIVINRTDQILTPFDVSMNFHVVKTIDEARALMQGDVTQMVCPWEAIDKAEIQHFDHQTDWYVFGPASGWYGNHFGDTLLTLPQHGVGAAHAVHVATAVMFFRAGWSD